MVQKKVRFIAWFVVLAGSALAAMALAEESPPTGARINGHVYRADTGAPLANIVVTLEHGSGDHRYSSVKTAADGGFEFRELAPDVYWLAANGPGFVASFYDCVGTAPIDLRRGGSATRRDFRLAVQPRITVLPVDPLVAAYGETKRAGLHFETGKFSPDGSMLALVLSDITVGAPEAVWIYDVRSHRMVAVAARGDGRDGVRDLEWDTDGKLYVLMGSSVSRVATFTIAATMSHVEEVERPPPSIDALFEARRADLVEELERRSPPRMRALLEAQRGELGPLGRPIRSGRFVVFTDNEGHGDIHLRARRDGARAPFELARGGWDLRTYLLDIEREAVLFPKPDCPYGITSFDLKARRKHVVLMQTGEAMRLLDQTRDRKWTAFTVYGECVANESVNQWVLPRSRPPSLPPRAPAPWNLCLVEL